MMFYYLKARQEQVILKGGIQFLDKKSQLEKEFVKF